MFYDIINNIYNYIYYDNSNNNITKDVFLYILNRNKIIHNNEIKTNLKYEKLLNIIIKIYFKYETKFNLLLNDFLSNYNINVYHNLEDLLVIYERDNLIETKYITTILIFYILLIEKIQFNKLYNYLAIIYILEKSKFKLTENILDDIIIKYEKLT